MPARMASGRDDRHTMPWKTYGSGRWTAVGAGSWRWISESFSTLLDHAHLREFLQLRVRDGVLKRLIGKWLKAGVMEDGQRQLPRCRKPARGRDFALAGQRVPALCAGRVVPAGGATASAGSRHLIRYADDFVILFRHEDDARRVMEVLPNALANMA